MKIVTFEQNTPEWYDARKGVPSASEFKRILTSTGKVSKSLNGYIADLIGSMTDQCMPEGVEHWTNRVLQHGQATEPEARRCFEITEEVSVIKVGFITDDAGRAGCSPDGLILGTADSPGAQLVVIDGREYWIAGGLELKAPLPGTQWERLLENRLPPEHTLQVHGALAVTGLPYWYWFSYAPGIPPLSIKVEADEFTEKVKAALADFHEEYMAALVRLQVFPEKVAHHIKEYAERQLAEREQSESPAGETESELPDSASGATTPSGTASASPAGEFCQHERLNEEGICRKCGADCRGIGGGSGVLFSERVNAYQAPLTMKKRRK